MLSLQGALEDRGGAVALRSRLVAARPGALEPEGVRLERHVADDAIDRLAVFTSGAVAITDRHRVARIVSADLETELGRYQIARPDLLRALGRDRLVAAFDDSVEIWDLGADVRSPRERLRGDAAILALAVLSDGRIVTAHYGGRVWLWTPTEGW